MLNQSDNLNYCFLFVLLFQILQISKIVLSNLCFIFSKNLMLSGWIIDSVIVHNINISKYNISAGSSYINLTKELDYPRKGLIHIQNINDNE